MNKNYKETRLREIAGKCHEFEHIISAMGYGASLANVSPEQYIRRCSDCVHWFDGHCSIFLKAVEE